MTEQTISVDVVYPGRHCCDCGEELASEREKQIRCKWCQVADDLR